MPCFVRSPIIYLIGINGLKRSGKNTVHQIVEGVADNVKGVGFSDNLKVLAAYTLGLTGTREELIAMMDEAKESWVIDVRETEQTQVWDSPGRLNNLATVSLPVANLTGRQYLQNLGSYARTVFGDTFWIDQVLPQPKFGVDAPWSEVQNAHLQNRYPDVDVLCVTDLRYPNEADRIKALGGVVWEVRRPGLTSDGHSTETPLPDPLIDWQINNDGSLADLERKVEEAMSETLR